MPLQRYSRMALSKTPFYFTFYQPDRRQLTKQINQKTHGDTILRHAIRVFYMIHR